MAIRKATTKAPKAIKRYAEMLYTAILATGGALCPTCHNYMQHIEPCPGWDAVMGAGRTVTWAVTRCPVCDNLASACDCAAHLDEAA